MKYQNYTYHLREIDCGDHSEFRAVIYDSHSSILWESDETYRYKGEARQTAHDAIGGLNSAFYVDSLEPARRQQEGE